jgi:hypothetical protein
MQRIKIYGSPLQKIIISIITVTNTSALSPIIIHIIVKLILLRCTSVSAERSLFRNCGFSIIGNSAALINNITGEMYYHVL